MKGNLEVVVVEEAVVQGVRELVVCVVEARAKNVVHPRLVVVVEKARRKEVRAGVGVRASNDDYLWCERLPLYTRDGSCSA